jgi:hypothetical protein
VGGQERNDEIHRPVSDSHYGKLLWEDARECVGLLRALKNPLEGGLLIKYQDINNKLLVVNLLGSTLYLKVFKHNLSFFIKNQS